MNNNDNIYQTRAMDNGHDNKVAFFGGAIGTFLTWFAHITTYLIDFNVLGILLSIVQAGIVGFIGGGLGIAGKDVYGWMKRKIFKPKK